MRRSALCRPAALLLLAALPLGGCTSWRSRDVPAPDVMAAGGVVAGLLIVSLFTSGGGY